MFSANQVALVTVLLIAFIDHLYMLYTAIIMKLYFLKTFSYFQKYIAYIALSSDADHSIANVILIMQDKLDLVFRRISITLQWRRIERDGVKKTSKLRVTGPCAGNLPVAGEFHAQKASNAEFFSIWWRHHDFLPSQWCKYIFIFLKKYEHDKV